MDPPPPALKYRSVVWFKALVPNLSGTSMGFVEDYFSMEGSGGPDNNASNEGATHLLLGSLVPNRLRTRGWGK